MQVPDVKHLVRDEIRDITFEVHAFRNLSPKELAQVVYDYSTRSRKKLKKHSTFKIPTIIGANGR